MSKGRGGFFVRFEGVNHNLCISLKDVWPESDLLSKTDSSGSSHCFHNFRCVWKKGLLREGCHHPTIVISPALPRSENEAPSKFILKQSRGGRVQWVRVCGFPATSRWWGSEAFKCLKFVRACLAWESTYDTGKSRERTLIWFRRCQTVHTTIAISSKFFPSAWMKAIKSLKDWKLCSCRNSNPCISSGIPKEHGRPFQSLNYIVRTYPL